MSVIDPQRWLRASHHLDVALDLPPNERQACLAALRVEDPETAAEVEALLAEHNLLSAEGFLNAAPPVPPAEVPLAGVTIGAYTLVSPIGHGGMGIVWLAERSDGRFEGRAALKLLNTSRVGRAGEERFKREGTILARLTHPHIGRLIDAGVTASGQPYLVLEHIVGQHIDRFCDDKRLTVEDRIRLFLDIQAAVAHAHANLIVHRDLKPSNVLVTENGHVKLLDFGIAKLLEDNEGANTSTRLTVEGAHALTPKYAAPEQVTGDRITTATDVYALGVLLFELLSGRHPMGLDPKSPAEFVKRVADTEPNRLSSAVPDPDPVVASMLAARRSTTPDRLHRMLRGDLDTIVGKALKKNPSERYESVAEFEDDLRRFLDHQPISARPDSLRYRVAKFVRRHRPTLAAAAAAIALLVGLTAFYTVRLTAERDRARLQADKASKASELLTDLLRGADPYRTPDAKEPTVQNLLDIGAERVARDLVDQPELQAEMFNVIGRTYQRMGIREKGEPLLQQALLIGRRAFPAGHAVVAQSLNNLGVLYTDAGDARSGEPLLVESLAMRRRLLGPEDKDVAVTLVELARALRDQFRDQEAEAPIREALAIRRKIFGEEHRETATSKNELALLLLDRGELDEAERLARENLATSANILGPDHPNATAARSNLGLILNAKGHSTAAEALFREAREADRKNFGETSRQFASDLNNIARSAQLLGRPDEAEPLFQEAVRVARLRLPPDHRRLVMFELNLARVRIEHGDAAGTADDLRRVLAARQRIYPAGDWRIGQAQSLLGAAFFARGEYDEAEALLLSAHETLKPVGGYQDHERLDNRARLALLYQTLGRADEARAYR